MSTLDKYSRFFTLDSRLFTLDSRHLLSTLDPRLLDTLAELLMTLCYLSSFHLTIFWQLSEILVFFTNQNLTISILMFVKN